MPLVDCPGDVFEVERIGFGFIMLEGTREVLVWVDKGALGALSDLTKGSERTALNQRRSSLEVIASANYDAGIIEPDGSTIIRREDILALH